MAYYNYNYHESYLGKNYRTPHGGNYDIVPLMNDSSYEFSNQNFLEYNPTPHFDAYDPAMNRSVIAYSASTFSEPKSTVYDPYSYRADYSPAVTQFRISFSVSEFNEPEFEEYDPTPYGGGYDLALTYGKPLPPSEETCYPSSLPDSSAVSSKEIVEESAAKPHIEVKPTPAKEDEQQPQAHASNGDERNKEYDKPSVLIKNEDSHENYSDGGNSYEYYKRVPHVPSGYGLESMDLCESIFGYWPCLATYNRKGHDCHTKEDSSCNQWQDTVDYLFGSSYPYGERRDEISSYGDPIYSYERRHQE